MLSEAATNSCHVTSISPGNPPCMNQGYCSSGNYCSCYDGFRGSRCEIG